jgi:dTDP-4-amino-4,6-dideoxygalactose transaminase
MIPVNMPQIGREEIQAVSKVLKSRILTGRFGSGPNAAQFEKNFARFARVKHSVAVNTGTAALHLALSVAGIKTGDEIILPSFTFIATAEAVALTGATPVFADIDPKTYNLDPDGVEAAITSKTKAVLPVDLYGLPAETDRVRAIAEKHSLKIIEDAAQAHGASYKGKPPGSFVDMACWSFYASKNMTTGEGGMITTNNDEYASLARAARSHGEMQEYVSSTLGQNYRMPEIEAAIGLVQLKRLPAFIETRRRNAESLARKLADVKELILPVEPRGCRSSWYLYTVRIREGTVKVRDRVVEDLNKHGVGAAIYYHTPIHMMPYYRRFGDRHLPNTEEIADRAFSLPVHPGVTEKDVDYIAKSVKQAVKKHISI